MLDIQAKINNLVSKRTEVVSKLNEKRFKPIESGLNALENVLEFIDDEYVPHFEKLNKCFVLRIGNGRTIHYNVGYPSFVYCNGHRLNVETISTLIESAKEEPKLWQREFVDLYSDIDLGLIETNLTKILLDKISDYELELSLLEQELAEE